MTTNQIRTCFCANVMGQYRENGLDIEIDVTKGDWSTVMVVGIDNNLLMKGTLPSYHGNPYPAGATFFEQWGSAVIVIPPYILNDTYKLDENRFPEVVFWTQEKH